MPPTLCPYSPFPSSESLDLAEPTRMTMIFICFYVSPSRCAKCRACTLQGARQERKHASARAWAGRSLRTTSLANPSSCLPRPSILFDPYEGSPALLAMALTLLSCAVWCAWLSLSRAEADHTQALAFLPALPALLLSTLCLAPSTLASLDRRQAETAALSALTSGPVAYVGYTASCTTSCAAMTSAANVRPLYSTQPTTLTRR